MNPSFATMGFRGGRLFPPTRDRGSMVELIGKRIGGCRVVGQIGKGAGTDVWLVEHPTLGRQAMKTLSPDLAGNKGAVTRFIRTAWTMSHLNHPNITPVYHHGIDEELGIPFYTMRCHLDAEQEALHPAQFDMAHFRETADVEALKAFVETITNVLTYAHEKELPNGERCVLHLGIKASNVFYDARHRRYLLSDFGMWRLWPGGEGMETMTEVPLHLAPEQCRRDETLTPATDSYGLGVFLYELLFGHPPFRAENAAAWIEALRLGRVRWELPEKLARERWFDYRREKFVPFFEGLLAPSPHDRFPSAQACFVAFLEALEPTEESMPQEAGRLAQDDILSFLRSQGRNLAEPPSEAETLVLKLDGVKTPSAKGKEEPSPLEAEGEGNDAETIESPLFPPTSEREATSSSDPDHAGDTQAGDTTAPTIPWDTSKETAGEAAPSLEPLSEAPTLRMRPSEVLARLREHSFPVTTSPDRPDLPKRREEKEEPGDFFVDDAKLDQFVPPPTPARSRGLLIALLLVVGCGIAATLLFWLKS
ncbi:MAG: hypothetical protein D6812_06225 [Deltaproteobacteria bacterium]|nr:MAG: hypothetical protein D6812_06225 [Deltaproteobacteria bacterium]